MADYEKDEEVTLSCEENWGDAYAIDRSLPLQLSDVVNDLLRCVSDKRILDLNADTGRLAFELARTYKDVTALDFTARMIRIPIQLQEQGFARYTMKDEGELVFYRDVVLDDFGLAATKNRILFMQADAMNLKPNYSGYDLIIAPALLEELSDPNQFLSQIHTRLNNKGYLILASNYEWDPQKTNRDKWPGGFKRDGEPVTSLEGIRKVLEPNFELYTDPQDVIRTLKRSSRITERHLMQITIWKKK